MAEAIIQVVLENLSSLLQNELRLFVGFDQDLKRLSSTLTAIKATLEDAEEKQFSNRAIKDWLQKLKDAAWVLDDILDECATQALELDSQGFNFKSGLLGKVQSFLLSSFHPKHVVFRCKIAEKLTKIRERLDEIAEEKNQFHFIDIHHATKRSRVMDWRETTSTIQPKICGREKEKDKIVDSLVVDASNADHLSIFTILGMGGLGKTTLAQLIFNHDRVVKHFEQRIWVCVSEDFSLKRMAKAIIQSASGVVVEDLNLEPLQRRLQELLRGKRYLLVLDDVWDDDQDNWERLKYALTCGAKGASILVTTRLTKVASIMGTTPPHQLSTLSENDCWKLFKQRAFEPNEIESAELLVIGKEIVKKCKGVPLAAKALGSLLRFKREEKEWLYVKESKLWSITQDENSVMPALRLSYLNLPIKLRPCFALCALFPKDTRISKHLLIDLWMSNGFISSDEMLEVEDVGEEVFNELYWRSFFQDIETDIFGKITRFKMHDLVHDLSQSVAKEVCHITYDNDVTSLPERISHLMIHRDSFQEANSIEFYHAKSLKTCMFKHHENPHDDQLPLLVLRCYSLRALVSDGLINLPPSIGNLKHLRYLNLSYGNFKTLPESLCMLLNLQILKLECCFSLQKLPNRLKRLKALRHLYLNGCYSLSSLPPNIGELTSLRTLTMYIVGKEKGFLLTELRQLHIKGKLHIKQLENVKSEMDVRDSNMASKQLNELSLTWGKNHESQLQGNVEQIIEMLQPQPQHLQTLGVGGYRGVRFPQWMGSSSLKNLTSVTLADCESCLGLPALGQLPSLKSLKIRNMNLVKYVVNEMHVVGVGGYKALEFLVVEKMPNLIRLSQEEEESMFQSLSKLQIIDCPRLVLPCLSSLKELRIKGKYNQDMLSSIHKFSSLEYLQLFDNKELICFPFGILGDLISLKKLDIYRYSKLEVLSLGITNLIAMQELYIKYCFNLEPLTEQVCKGLHSLKILHIVSYPKFNFSSGFQYLTSLEELWICDCPKVESLHEALQHMTSLQSLKLADLRNLVTLPDCLGNLALLHSLTISDCPKLVCFPTSIRHLTALKSLEIFSCSQLEARCEKETGEDWPKIAHIPHIHLFTGSWGFGGRPLHYKIFIEGKEENNDLRHKAMEEGREQGQKSKETCEKSSENRTKDSVSLTGQMAHDDGAGTEGIGRRVKKPKVRMKGYEWHGNEL